MFAIGILVATAGLAIFGSWLDSKDLSLEYRDVTVGDNIYN